MLRFGARFDPREEQGLQIWGMAPNRRESVRTRKEAVGLHQVVVRSQDAGIGEERRRC